MEYALAHQQHMKGLVVADMMASAPDYGRYANEVLAKQMKPEVLAEVRALEAALVSSLSSLDSNRLGYEVGVRINIDVLNAENQVYVTRRDLARARFNTLLSQLKLKAAVGSLAEADLERINVLFEAP